MKIRWGINEMKSAKEWSRWKRCCVIFALQHSTTTSLHFISPHPFSNRISFALCYFYILLCLWNYVRCSSFLCSMIVRHEMYTLCCNLSYLMSTLDVLSPSEFVRLDNRKMDSEQLYLRQRQLLWDQWHVRMADLWNIKRKRKLASC